MEKKRSNFIPDGIVNYEIYNDRSVKVLYILKEVNGGKDWDLRSFLRNGGDWRTWNNIVRWQFGIEGEEVEKSFNNIEKVTQNIRKRYLNKIAVINLKKNPVVAAQRCQKYGFNKIN